MLRQPRKRKVTNKQMVLYLFVYFFFVLHKVQYHLGTITSPYARLRSNSFLVDFLGEEILCFYCFSYFYPRTKQNFHNYK